MVLPLGQSMERLLRPRALHILPPTGKLPRVSELFLCGESKDGLPTGSGTARYAHVLSYGCSV